MCGINNLDLHKSYLNVLSLVFIQDSNILQIKTGKLLIIKLNLAFSARKTQYYILLQKDKEQKSLVWQLFCIFSAGTTVQNYSEDQH